MHKAIQTDKYKFVDMRPTTETIKFTSDDYTEATVNDISHFVGAENLDELQSKMQKEFDKIESEAKQFIKK